MKITVQTQEAQKGFYPTPPALAEELLSGIQWKTVRCVLEPSAGKGNLVDAVAEKNALLNRWDRESALPIDCIEIDPFLRVILSDAYSENTKNLLCKRIAELEGKRQYDTVARKYIELSENEKLEKSILEQHYRQLNRVEVRIIHDDFLTFESRKHYDLIVMNPPFADADLHLLKAISIAERFGSTIRCILNAETLRNPYTNRRKMLAQKLNELGAEITFKTGAFMDAERSTDVEIAMVKLVVPEPQYATDPESLKPFPKLPTKSVKCRIMMVAMKTALWTPLSNLTSMSICESSRRTIREVIAMYENTIEVTVRITVSLKVNSYSVDDDSIEAVFAEAEQIALESVNVENPCIVVKEEISDIDCRASVFCAVDNAA